MSDYIFNKTKDLCIPKLKEDIAASAMTNKALGAVKDLTRAGSRETGLSSIVFTLQFQGTLSGADQTMLDGIVDGSVGYRRVGSPLRETLQNILDGASGGAQKSSILAFLDKWGGSFTSALIMLKFGVARGRASAAFLAGDITEADRDLIFAAVPADKWEAI